jgi:hypothetical protein
MNGVAADKSEEKKGNAAAGGDNCRFKGVYVWRQPTAMQFRRKIRPGSLGVCLRCCISKKTAAG